MEIGFFLRKCLIELTDFLRDVSSVVIYFLWLIFDPTKFKKVDASKIKNILVVYSGAIGDTYSMTGILNALTKKRKDIRIYYLTSKDKWKFVTNPKIKLVSKGETKSLIESKKIDAAFFFKGITISKQKDLFDISDYPSLLKIPHRISYIPFHFYSFFKLVPLLSTRKFVPLRSHYFKDRLNIFKKYFGIDEMVFYEDKSLEDETKIFLNKLNLDQGEKIIALHIGSGKTLKAIREGKVPSSVWPIKRWASLANYFVKKYGARIVFTGLREEKEEIQKIIEITKNKKTYNAAGEFSIEGLASFFKKISLLVTIDGAPAHIAGQLKVPQVVLFGAGKPHYHKPLSTKLISLGHLDSCIGCRRAYCPEKDNVCVKNISLDEVKEAADKMIRLGDKDESF